jgi:hypothetical protein
MHVLGHLHPSDTELWAGEVPSGLKALAALGILLIAD